VTTLLVAAVATLVVVLAWLLLTPLDAHVHVEGSLDDGAQADATLRFLPLTATVRSRPTDVEVRVLGVRLPLPSRQPGKPKSAARSQQLSDAYELVNFVVRRRRDLVVRRIDGEVRYGFEDPALTGQLHGLVSVARPVVDPDTRVAWMPDWSMQDVLAGRLDADLRLFAGRVGLALGWFLVSRSVRRRRARGGPRRRPARSDTSRTATAPAG
jgi:hypothetical protein